MCKDLPNIIILSSKQFTHCECTCSSCPRSQYMQILSKVLKNTLNKSQTYMHNYPNFPHGVSKSTCPKFSNIC